MKILCKVPSEKFFDFFEDLYELFGDNWEMLEMDDSLVNYLGCEFFSKELLGAASGELWQRHLALNNIRKSFIENNKISFTYYALVECPDNIMFKLKWC